MNEFTFDLQRFDAPTWSSSNGGKTWTCQVQVGSSHTRTYTVTSTVALTSVSGDPQSIDPSNSVTLTGSSDLSGATITIHANSGTLQPAAFKFIYGDTLYRADDTTVTNQTISSGLISRNISAGDTLTLNSGQDFFRVVNGSTYTDYALNTGAGATLTINSDGTTPILTVPSGSSAAYLYPTGSALILLSGSLKSFLYAAPSITLGQTGLTWKPQFSSGDYYINSTVTENSDGSTSINLTSYNYYDNSTVITNGGPITFSTGAISYSPATTANSNSTVNLTVKDGKTYIRDVSTGDTASISGKNFTLDSGTITLIADNSDSSKFYITDLDKGDKFTVDDVSYTMGGTLLVARYTDSGGTEHILIGNVSQDTQDGLVTDGEVSSDALDVDNSWLLEEIHEIDGSLTINNELIGKLTTKNSLAIVKTFDHVNEDPDESYGSFTRATDSDGITTYSLLGVDSSKSGNLKYSAVTIEDNLSIQLNQYLTDVPITVNSTTFTSRDNTDFTYATTSSGLSLSSASVSLISGSLHSDSNQSVGAGLYSVSGYNGDFDITRASSLSTSDVIISDIDTNESFQLSTGSGLANYTLLSAGNLLFESIGSNRRVYDFGQPSGSTGISANLASLNSSVNGALVIAPNNRLLEIGSTNKSDAVLFNDSDNPTSLFASLDASGSNFTLSSLSGAANFHSAVDSISISAGNASIYKSLVSDGVTIITPYTTFLVSDSDSNFFSVDATASTPSISNASNITLLSGSITATARQSITLGQGGRTLKLGDSSDSVTISLSGSTFSVNTNSSASFTFNNRSFVVTAGNGISLDISGTDVTLRALDTGDQFSYESTSYSITGGGFMKGSPPNDCALWIANSSSYSLANNSVSVADMTTASNWGELILVSDDKITLYPASNNSGVLMSDDFANTYGRVEKNGDDSYLLSANDNDGGSLKEIFIDNGTRKSTLTANADNFLNVSIASDASTLLVCAADNDSFQVTVDGSARESGLLGSGLEAVLYNGSLSANSSIASITVGGQVVHSDQDVTVLTDGTSGGGSLAGLEGGNSFRVDGTNYTFTKAGLRNGTGNQLRRGTKIGSETTVMPLSLVSGTSDWVNMIGTSSISGASISGNWPHEGFLVDTFSGTVNPTKLYGEVASVSGGGFELSTVTNGDAWEDGYTINVDETTVSIDSAFAAASINAVRSGAGFVVQTGESNFIVTDRRTEGALIGGAEGITQTAGLVAAGDSGLESVTVGDTTVYKTGGLELDVSVSGGEATLSSLEEGESFFIGGQEYSVKAELGLITDTQIFINNSVTSSKTAVLSEVVDTDNWLYIASVQSNILTVPPEAEGDSWIILDEAKSKRYAQLTSTEGGYSLSKDTNDWESNYTIAVSANGTLSLTSDFSGAQLSLQSSKAAFTVSDKASYSVVDSSGGASVNARTINQTAGTVALSSSSQSIVAGGSTVSGAGVKVSVSGGSVSVGGVDGGETFRVDGTSYTLLSNGRLQRSDGALWNDGLLATTDGAVNVASLKSAANWNDVIQTDASGNLTLDSSAASVLDSVNAYVVNANGAASIYGTAGKSGTTYTLNTTGNTGSSLRSVTFTAACNPVSLSSALANVSLKAGANEFMATRATGGYTVNYDGTALSVGTAQVVSLSGGALNLSGSQTVLASGQSVSGASETVQVSLGGSEVIVGDIGTAGESVQVNTESYELQSGEITVHITDGTTTVEDLTVGDKFKIGNVTYSYTAAGLTKSAAGSEKVSYLLKEINPADGKMALSSLQSTSEDIWLGILAVTDGVIELTTGIESSVVLVDDATNPTKNYGQIERNGSGGYVLSKGAATDTYEAPSAITVDEDVTATISADYSDKPVSTTGATAVTVYQGTQSVAVGGTVNKFVPSTLTFTPASDDDFTLDGVRYVMTEAGLTQVVDTATTKLWTTAGVSDYVLPDSDAWSNMIRLNEDNALDFTEVSAASGANIVVDEGATERWATLDYTGGVYDIKYLSTNRIISQIQTANGTASFTVNFGTTFTTGNGTYTINGETYTGNGLEITATAVTSTLSDGTVTLNAGAPSVTAGNVAIGTTTGEITATATSGSWSSLGNLSDGDIFTADSTSYKVYGSTTLVQLNSSGNPNKLYIPTLSDGTITYANLTGTNYADIVALNADKELDLTAKPAVNSAIVVELRNSEVDPTIRIAQLTYDTTNNAVTLNETTGGQPENMAAILLGTAVKTLTCNFDATVTTDGSAATYTLNDNPFAAQDALTVLIESGEAILTDGTVTLNASTVKTRYGSLDEEITANTGTVSVNVASSAVTLGDLDAGDEFTVDSSDYTMTTVGLTNGGGQLNCDASAGTITTANLTAGDWKAVVPAPGGVLTINSETPADAFVANVGTPTAAVKYGTLNLAGGVYTLTQADTDTALSALILDGVTAQLPSTCAGTSITAGEATFSVTASGTFTINADTHALTNVTAINLTAGTFNATNNIPITVGTHTITTTSGTFTVGIDDAGIFVGDLAAGETFTVDGVEYKMTGVGLLDTTNNQLRTATTNIYYLGETFQRIIAADGSSLDLTDETTDALVYDSVTNPTTHMATLTFDGDDLNLANANGGIDTITLGANRTLTLDFAATINASGTTTVNSATFAGSGDLILDATADTATLQEGTITLNASKATHSAQATADENLLDVTSGEIQATAADGKFTHISKLNNNDAFTFDKTYTQTSIGLLSGNLLNTEVSTSVDIADLSGTNWQTITQADGGNLTINSETPASLVVDITADKSNCKRYGTLTTGDGYTLTLDENDSTPTSIHLDGVKATLPEACAASTLSANDAEFSVTASKAFTIDATDTVNISDVEAINLTAGTLLATNNIPITIGTHTITTTSGTFTVGIDDAGIFVGGLTAGETFTVDGVEYKMTGVGLLDTTNNQLRTATTNIYYLGETFQRIIAADGSSLDLTDETTDALVYDSVTNPTTRMATLTFSGTDLNLANANGGIDTITLGANRTLTLDFAATINASGTTTVNSATFAGSGDLILDATADTATLQEGTITLNASKATHSAQATADENLLDVTSGAIKATAADGKFTHISKLNNNDAFTFDKNYVQTSIGLLSDDDDLLNVNITTDVDISDLSGTNWQTITQADGGNLTINSETPASLIVDITDDKADCKRYGTLTTGDGYTLTLDENDSTPTSIHLDGVKATLPEACAASTLSANDAEFSVTASKAFTIDATDTVNISNVDAINLTAGTLAATNDIPITVGENVITTTSGTLTVGIDSGGAFVGGLDIDETFTVDDSEYKMTTVGLLDLTGHRLRTATTDTYHLSDAFERIIAAHNATLDLSDETESAIVCDSVVNPTTRMANLNVDDKGFTLTNADGGISTINLGADKTLTLDFDATINASGDTTVNGVNYNGRSKLIINATDETSTLYSGTITLASGTSAQATNDDTALAITAGTIQATAADGHFYKLAAVNNGDAFDFGGQSYRQSAVGLVSGSTISEELAGGTIDLTLLDSANWQNFFALSGGTLDLTGTVTDAIILDNAFTSKLAELTTLDNRINLKGGDGAAAIETVKVSAGTNLSVDFETNVTAPAGSVTVNNTNFLAAGNVTLHTDGESATLYTGSVTLNATCPTVHATDDTSALTVNAGSINANALDGLFVSITDLDPAESFTFDGKTYTQSAVGLISDELISETLAGDSIEIFLLETTDDWIKFIAPEGDTLDLTSATDDALVLDNTTNPTVKLATLTADIIENADAIAKLDLKDNGAAADTIKTVDIAADTDLTVDFITQITAPEGAVVVNGQSYLGTTNLLLDSDGETSTLNTGSVILNNGDSVVTSSGHIISDEAGDGISVTAAGDELKLDALNVGDTFTVDGTQYRISEGGLLNSSGKLWTAENSYSDGLTANQLTADDNWSNVLLAKDAELTLNDGTLANGNSAVLVDDLTAPTKTLGTLARDDQGTYSLTKDATNSLSAINVRGVKAQIDNALADVPLTLNDTALAITPSEQTYAFTVDATTDIPTADNLSSIELSTGKLQLLDGQTLTLTEDAHDFEIRAGNGTFHVLGEDFTLDNLPDDATVRFDVQDDSVNAVSQLPLDSDVTIDGTTYTSPADDATLTFDAKENDWFFDGALYSEYTITVDPLGNILVVPGVRFSNVIDGDKTLSDDGNIKFAADLTKTPVTVLNQNKTPLIITDANGYTWTENFTKDKVATFTGNGISADSLTAIAGVSFTLHNTDSLTAGDVSITATEDDCEVGIADAALSIDKPADISAPADIALTLNAGDFSVNGAQFIASGATSAKTTDDGVAIDLAQSEPILTEDITLSSAGSATLSADSITLTGGALASNTLNKTITVDGSAYLDDIPVNTAVPTDIRLTNAGVDVGDQSVTIRGDEGSFSVNVPAEGFVGLEDIGGSEGVTVNGLFDASIKTDLAGSLTSDRKTFAYDKRNVIFGYDDGNITSISGAKNIIGDFNDSVQVNGDLIQLIGSEQVTVQTSDDGVNKIHVDSAGSFEVSGKSYTIRDDDDFAFRMQGGQVEGIASLESGTLIINQDEDKFKLNNEKLTLNDNSEPVTLEIADSQVNSVSGVDGTINGLTNATVSAISHATINNKPVDINGSDDLDAIVKDRVTSQLIGLTDGATVTNAPDLRITTAENGTFTFPDKSYTLNDTLDATWDFLTNSQSRVKGFDNFSGSISGGDLSGKTLNGDSVNAIGDDLIIYTDGEKITDITGMEDGSEVDGDFGNATLKIPEGNTTINGIGYTLEGDEDGAYVSGNGSIISGVDKDATLTVDKGGTYVMDGETFTLQAGDSVTTNYDGAYKVDPTDPPITEKTDAEKILARDDNPVYIDPTTSGGVQVDLSGSGDLALIDSGEARATVQAGEGNDSIVVRHGASADINLDENGSALIIPTAGRVTLENYNGDNAAIRTYDYSDIPNAIKTNAIKFGDGVMTLGDAVVTYDPTASATGATSGDLYNAHGQRQAFGFTHTAGGELDMSGSTDEYILKGNYAENTDDTLKHGDSTLTGGTGNDTLLGGAGDVINGGGGANQIYLTDESLRHSYPDGATIVMSGGNHDTVHGFSYGHSTVDDEVLINSVADMDFDYLNGSLVLKAAGGLLTFEDIPESNAGYELKLTDGNNTLNAAIAKENEVLEVGNTSAADIYYGNAAGISFSEYTGLVEVNLNENAGTVDGRAVAFSGLNKVYGGAGNSTLIGSTGQDTLAAGTGEASIWSNRGNDLMIGSASEDKQGATTFYYEPGDGRDTIENLDFMANATDLSDKIMLDEASGVTNVYLRGDDVMIGINNSADDYLTLVNAKGQSFRLNDDIIAKVDDVVEYDGFTNCYVGAANNSTLHLGADMGDVEIWLSDDSLEYHGTMYDGNFAVLDASDANGNNILAGGEGDNLILGGKGSNSIWGGYTQSNDTLIGGTGANTFYFGAGEGHDRILNAHDGDLVSLEDIFYDDVIRADITDGGAYLELNDGSTLEINSTANLDYRLADGTTYTANRTTREWNQK